MRRNVFYAQLILFFILGLAVGSFLNVIILRIDDLSSVWRGRSLCPKCKKPLSWFDLIPLVSYIMLLGKCRYCKKPISWQYPLMELAIGLFFLISFLKFGLTISLAYYLVVFSILTVVFVYDLKTQLVPEVFVWIALTLSFALGWYFGQFSFLEMIFGGLIGGGLFALMVFISKEKWMGSGDIKVGLILGLLLGYPVVILGLFTSFVLGSIVGLLYIKFASKTMKDTLPFAPFLILSAYLCLFFGKTVINWYWGTFIF